MSLVVGLLILICLVLLGAIAAKPVGWVVVVLAAIALLLFVLAGANGHLVWH